MKSKSRQEGVRGRHRHLKKPDKPWMSCLMVSPPQEAVSCSPQVALGVLTQLGGQLVSELELL